MKRITIITVIISILLFSLIAKTPHFMKVQANPFIHGGWVPPDASTKPPTISILSPKNNATYKDSKVTLRFNVSVGYSRTAIQMFILEIFYKTDWQNETNFVYKSSSGKDLKNPFNLNLTNVPDGNHNIEITACEMGDYAEDIYKYTFMINGSSKVNFAVDTTQLDITDTEFPITIVIVSIVTVVIGLGIFAYFKKIKK